MNKLSYICANKKLWKQIVFSGIFIKLKIKIINFANELGYGTGNKHRRSAE